MWGLFWATQRDYLTSGHSRRCFNFSGLCWGYFDIMALVVREWVEQNHVARSK